MVAAGHHNTNKVITPSDKNEGSAEKFCSFHLPSALELRDYSGSCWVKCCLLYGDKIFKVIMGLKEVNRTFEYTERDLIATVNYVERRD